MKAGKQAGRQAGKRALRGLSRPQSKTDIDPDQTWSFKRIVPIYIHTYCMEYLSLRPRPQSWGKGKKEKEG